MYRRLEPAHIIETSATLRRRIEERFSASGLSKVAAELEAIASEAAALSKEVAAPDIRLRALIGGGLLLLALLIGSLLLKMPLVGQAGDWSNTFQGLEALVNDAVFTGAAIYFLLGLEVRKKRRRVLGALHVLRSLAHIVDMHQLTKDPERLFIGGSDTTSSPKRTMTPFELGRYLDYSSEMLAIVSKVAALYVQEFDDPVTVDAASAVEELAVNLSRSIWQKILVLQQTIPRMDWATRPATESRSEHSTP
jgi:hypothetical protein